MIFQFELNLKKKFTIFFFSLFNITFPKNIIVETESQ